MVRIKRIKLVSVITAALALMIVALIVFFPVGIQNDRYNGKRPTDKEPANWITKDKSSWFFVKDESICFGELTFNGETLPVYYDFEHNNLISVYANDKEQVKIHNNEIFVEEETLVFFGKCKFKKSKVIISLYREDNPDYTEELIFYMEK